VVELCTPHSYRAYPLLRYGYPQVDGGLLATPYILQAGFENIGVVYQHMELHKGELMREDYDTLGKVVVKMRIERSAVAALDTGLKDSTSGSVMAIVVNESCTD
jgi:hypothetical protein